jgi:tetratricopeptide (TPR) repeat protein
VKRPFQRKAKEKKSEISEKKEITSLVDVDYNRKKLFKKGINLMADERLEEAVEVFEQALRIDPDNIETLMKLGYSRFHLDDHSGALRVYDKILDIDVTNPEAWNLKSLVHYEQKKYAKALDAAEKAVESDPTEALESLKRSIEIDVKNARKSIRDRDFLNVRTEDGFKKIEEVVVLESIRQGYHTIGAIVWTTFIDKIDVEKALQKLMGKGLIIQNEKRDGLHRIPVWDLAPDVAKRMGEEKKGLFGITRKTLPTPVKNLKSLSEAIQIAKAAIEEEDVDKAIEIFDEFIETDRSGQPMIENFFDEHREIRLWKIRLKDRGVDYIKDNKEKMLDLFDNIESTVTKKLREEIA